MARYKRYFPVSHDINSDPEFQELCAKHKVIGVRLFFEIMALLDQTDNHLKVTGGDRFLKSFRSKTGGNIRTISKAFVFMLEKKWICLGDDSGEIDISLTTVSQQLDNCFATVLQLFDNCFATVSHKCCYIYAPNYVKYHRIQVPKSETIGVPPNLPLPNLPSSSSDIGKYLQKKEDKKEFSNSLSQHKENRKDPGNREEVPPEARKAIDKLLGRSEMP